MSNPTDGWDDWGDDTSSQSSETNTQSSDDWGDWSDSNNQAQSTGDADDWGDWGDSNNTQQSSTNDSWNDWGSSTDQSQSNGSFIDSSQDTNQDWANQPQDYQTQPVAEPPIQTHFSTKTIAIIVAGAILVIALLLMVVDKVHIGKKDTTTTTNNTTTVQQEQQPIQSSNTSNSNTSNSNTTSSTRGSSSESNLNSATLVEIPNSTSMTYSNDTLKANGRVTDKKKYVQGKQIVYCVEITIAVGSSSETVNYYCTSATFNQIGKGDILIVNYVQVEDSYISITNVEK